MKKFGFGLLLVIVVTVISVGATLAFMGWGVSSEGPGSGAVSANLPNTLVAPTRSDYVDLLLTVVTVMLGGIGLVVTVGALVIGLVALKTLREIKDEASEVAKTKVEETIDEKVESRLTELARSGELNDVVERVIIRMNTGGPDGEEDADQEDESE